MPYKNKEKQREWYLKNRERLRMEAAEKYKENADKIKSRVNNHYHDNKDKIRERRSEINKKNPEQKKRWNSKYRNLNKDKINEWARENRNIVNEWKRRYYKKHTEKVKAYNNSKNNGWEKAPQRLQIWEIQDDAMLFNSTLPDKELAKYLGRSLKAVSTRRSILKKEFGEDKITN